MSEEIFILGLFLAGWLLLLGASFALVVALSKLGAWLSGERCWQDWAANALNCGLFQKRNGGIAE